MPNTTTNTPNTALPFLIVGQGIAGTAIAFELLRRGYGVVVVDDEHREAASAVAAGIVNPITGKRFAKSWNMERILAAMPAFYAAMARWVGDEGENGSFFAPKTILRALRSAADENTWLARSAWDGWREYVGEHLPDADDLKAALQPAAAFAAIAGGGKVDIARAVRLMQAYLRRVGAYHAGRFDYSALVQTDTGVQYGSIAACAVVFCEGANVRHNPYFNYLPLQPSKGEALAVLIPEYAECFEAYDDF